MYTIFKTIRQIYPIETKVVTICEVDPQGFQGTRDVATNLLGTREQKENISWKHGNKKLCFLYFVEQGTPKQQNTKKTLLGNKGIFFLDIYTLFQSKRAQKPIPTHALLHVSITGSTPPLPASPGRLIDGAKWHHMMTLQHSWKCTCYAVSTLHAGSLVRHSERSHQSV